MMCKKDPYILVLGVSVYDIFGFAHDKYRRNDSNPGHVRVSYGGVCRNIAENMARLGMNTRFISILGDDDKGKSLMQHAKDINLDMSESLVMKGESTPTYMAILNEKGELESAIVDMKITDKLSKEFIDSKEEIICNAEYMVLDPDNPKILEYILTKYKGKTKFFLDPVSAAKVIKVKHLLPFCHTIKPNRVEAEMLCGFEIKTMEDVKKAGRYFLSLGIKQVFISLDADGIYYNNGCEEGIVAAQKVKVVNVTGAGDACVAGLGYGFMNGLSIKDSVKYAIAMSIITIATEETNHPDMCRELVEEYISQIEWKCTEL